VTNFKSGSGNLDFGGDDEEGTADEAESAADDTPAVSDEDQQPAAESSGTNDRDADSASERPTNRQYPYFVRRNNVGDERDTRLEVHVRDKVADREAQFRHTLAEKLGATDVSKTDAREFALLAAFEHPELVVELMREEGFDELG